MPYGAALSIYSKGNYEALPFSIFCWVSKLFLGPIWPHQCKGEFYVVSMAEKVTALCD